MSKEQTPTDIRRQLIIDKYLHDVDTCNPNDLNTAINSAMKEYETEVSKAKVLEALEREVPKAHKNGELCKKEIGTLTTRANEYYQTQVKPKYER